MDIEQVSRVFCAVNEGKGKPVDGSYKEETFEGTFEEMCSLADSRAKAGGAMYAVTATVTRKAGGFGECKIKTTPMDGKGMENIEMAPGSSRSNPCYTLSVTAVPQPILTHKLADGIEGEKLDAMKALVNGASMGTLIDTSKTGERSVQKTIKEILSDDSSEIMKKIMKGVTSFYSPSVTLSVRYKVKEPSSINYIDACKIASPPGPFKTPAGKFNWLSMGTGVEFDGKECVVSDTYVLSGPEGWDKDIY